MKPERPYERLLYAALTGDRQLFAREDSIEADVADRAAAAGQAGPRSTPTTRAPGDPRPRSRCCMVTAAGRTRGCLQALSRDSKETGEDAARNDRPGPDGREHRSPRRRKTDTNAWSTTTTPTRSRRWPVRSGRRGCPRCSELAEKLATPRVVWVMVPAGDITTSVIEELAKTLESGDIVIDGGNSYYRDDIKHSKLLSEKGIHLLDCGTSGGVWGRERGYCLMIGGDDDAFAARRADVRHRRARGGRGAAHAGPRRRGRATGEGLPALRAVRSRALRQDGAQRHRVRDDGLSRRGAEHPAQCRHRQARPSRGTPKPRRCRIPSSTSTSSTSPTSPRCGAGAASSAPGCWT